MTNNIRIVNVETGEDLTGNYRLRHRNQDEGYKRSHKGRGPDFTFSAMDALHEVYSVLTTAQCGYLLLLQCHVNYETGMLVNTDKTPMAKADIIAVLQLEKKRSVFYNFFKAATDHGIIIEAGGAYIVNQRYHFRGATDNPYVIKSYTVKVKRVYREVKAADLGLIYRMLPLVHYETNAICSNPYESTPEQINFLDRAELAEAIGVSAGEISRRLPKMTFDGEYVIARVKVGGHEKYMFNPWVFYRKTTAPDSTLRAMFNVKPNKRRK